MCIRDRPKVVASPETGEKIAYGPLIYSEYQGWDTGVQVMNLSQVVNAKIKVYFLDRSGDVITTLVDWVCPRGSQTFFLPVVADLPGTWVGSIRVESQDWWTPGTNGVNAPDVVGVATLMKYGDVARTETQQAIAYNLLPEHKSYLWQVGEQAGGLGSGVGLLAIPSLLKDLDGSGVTSETAIMNLVAKPGFTDFAIYIYDQNGLLDFICEKLHSRQVEYIDLQTWGYVNNGFKGSAVISATFWEHDVFDPDGRFVRNLVGLGAVMVERTGTRLGEDIPGDEAAGDRGIPFALTTTGKTPTWCPGGFIPRCPGQPIQSARRMKNIRLEMPVMTSGMTSGAVVRPESSVRPLKGPKRASTSPASVPSTTASVAEIAATFRLRNAAFRIWSFCSSAPYHLVEKPPQTVTRRELLNE